MEGGKPQGRRKTRVGVVVSDKMDKTVVVAFDTIDQLLELEVVARKVHTIHSHSLSFKRLPMWLNSIFSQEIDVFVRLE